MNQESTTVTSGMTRQDEETYLTRTLAVVHDNIENYGSQVRQMQEEIEEMLERYHDNDTEVLTLLNNTITLHAHMKRALERNEKAQHKPYFGRIVFYDKTLKKEESIYIGRGGISKDATHQLVADWRAPVANAYYENGLGPCSYPAPGGEVFIDLKRKRTYEIEEGRLLDYFDSEVIANDDLLTKYLSRNKQAVLGEIVATIQKEQNEIIRKSPYRNMIVQGVAGSGKTTVAMHRISYILYNYAERFRPDDFYIVGSNRILLEYITGVLPDLDVYEVRQMTMEQLFVRLLYEDWDGQKYRIRQNDRSSNRGSIRGGLSWFQDLKTWCDKLEWDTVSRESIFLNPKQFVEGFQDGKTGVFDRTGGQPADPKELILLMDGDATERYIRQNPSISVQSKINMLNQRLLSKVKEAFLGKELRYTEAERKAITKAYRGRYGSSVWKRSIFDLYQDFLTAQLARGCDVDIPTEEFDVYDLAALAYLYKRIKETEVISEAHHIVIDEAQDFGMMAYAVLNFCIHGCTYTIMGDVSQNIHFGYGLNDWEELKQLLLTRPGDNFELLKKSYRNTVEISRFATNILHHGRFSTYPVEPILRHGEPVHVQQSSHQASLFADAADILKKWQEKGFDTIAVVCRDQASANQAAKELRAYTDVMENDLEKAVFGSGILVLPVEYTKGLEFDAVLILNPDRADYPVDDGHAKLLYVAATRALHELCVLYTENLTGLIADPMPERHSQDAPIPRFQTSSADSRKNVLLTAPPTGPKSTPPAEEKQDKDAILAAKRYKPRQDKPDSTPGSQPAAKPPAAAEGPVRKLPRGVIPPSEKLRPAGHAPIDLAIRWIAKQPDGLHLQSRCGLLRLSPVRSNIIRVTFSKTGKLPEGTHSKIAVDRTERFWMYKDAADAAELLTDELCLRVDKASGSIQYMTREKKLLLAERSRESRQLETSPDGTSRIWLYLNWLKKERLYSPGPDGNEKWELTGLTRYLSFGNPADRLPLILSDKGYGILLATDGPTLCCDVRPYGPYLRTENCTQLDFYFIAGKWQENILNSHAYLCGKL